MREARIRSQRGAAFCAALFATVVLCAPNGHGAMPQLGRQLVPDSDGDGVDDLLERVLNTLPQSADTDGDGWNDGIELARRSDPLVATDVPGPAAGQLSVGFWSRTARLPGFVRTFTFIYLPEGYPSSGVELELAVLQPDGGILHLGDSYLAGPEARTRIDFLLVSGDDEALVMIVGANLADTLIQSEGYMSAAAVAWHGAASAPEAEDRNNDAIDGFWLQLAPAGPILFRRPVVTPRAGGGSSASAVYLPIEPSAPPQGEPGQICFQKTVPVGYENGVVLSRVVTANCQDGWDATCTPTECAATLGDEYSTVDPVGLVGG